MRLNVPPTTDISLFLFMKLENIFLRKIHFFWLISYIFQIIRYLNDYTYLTYYHQRFYRVLASYRLLPERMTLLVSSFFI